ncbi:MAG: hypothetical protein QXV82_09150 [Ignisphaera sp.]
MNIPFRIIIGLILFIAGSVIFGKMICDVNSGVMDKVAGFLVISTLIIFLVIGLGWVIDELKQKRL